MPGQRSAFPADSMSIQQTERVAGKVGNLAEMLQAVLLEFRRRVPYIRGSAIADKSGLPIASDLPPKVNVMMVTAMSALAMQSCSNVLANLGLEPAERVVTESKDSVVVVKSIAGGTASLFAMMSGDVDRELAAKELDQAAREAEEILGA
jgi:predicted regulator of Ras-like GTPase activity (Roadblock/LC7/MglB family)